MRAAGDGRISGVEKNVGREGRHHSSSLISHCYIIIHRHTIRSSVISHQSSGSVNTGWENIKKHAAGKAIVTWGIPNEQVKRMTSNKTSNFNAQNSRNTRFRLVKQTVVLLCAILNYKKGILRL